MLSLELSKQTTNSSLTLTNRVLLVEDEELIRDMVILALEEEGYEVVVAHDGRKALDLLQSPEVTTGDLNLDLIVLDLMLPFVNGLDICRVLRYQGSIVPILILSAKASESDRVLGLEIGADDYLTKPFSMRELIARCAALIRRQRYGAVPKSPMRQFRDVTLFSQECRVLVRDLEINLSPKEFRLLELFMSYPRRVWSREQLIEQVWEPDFLGDTKTVDVHIRWLREKLEKDPSQPEYLITVRGFGYRFG
ncbi:response regulator transcription factor [Gloeocapsa sp. PCC 73106]|uniref:response regulator transcription factor n=1 Tax=Gloeocapsa sp. PCC 73106 TaxID=102232 RepID=UPI0002AD031E|nr:response regulator transcription factor [Gloeocapsa sp. PCC 73106]ELR98233.1 response regulator with CheY-like receiver domain and winged-helix DNA-binding domain [Gloeocapsa sp. PCC 73106]